MASEKRNEIDTECEFLKGLSKKNDVEELGQSFKLALVLLVFVGIFLLIVGFHKCVKNVKPKRKVVVFVLDDFIGERSHGGLVSDIIREYCFDKCEIRIKDAFGTVSKGGGWYIRSLEEVIEYTKEQPDVSVVLNISLGSHEKDEEEQRLIRELHSKGVIILAAAGNDNAPKNMYPASYKEVVAVAAVSGNEKSDKSNYGKHIEICGSGFGSKTFVRKETQFEGIYIHETKYYSIRGGTSFATARVTGLVAYLLRQRPELRPRKILELVKRKAAQVRDPYSGQLGAGRMRYYSTILAGDPLYQRVYVIKIASIFVAILLLFCARDSTFLVFCLVIFTPLLFILNVVTVQTWGLIMGSIAGSILNISIAAFLLLYIVKWKAKEKAHVAEIKQRIERKRRGYFCIESK